MTINSDKPKEECGVIALYAPNESVASMTYFGLHALQHRGQEAAGMAVSNGTEIHIPFRQLCLIYETVWYGNYEIDSVGYGSVDNKFNNLLGLMERKEYA